MITLIFLYKNDPLLLLSPEWFIPFNKFIAFPTGVPGNITTVKPVLSGHSKIDKTKFLMEA